MPSFNPDQANSISYVIRTLRPGWNHNVLMQTLTGLAVQGKPVADVVTAAFRAAQDPKAQAPTAILWDQYWVKPAGGNTDNGVRMCVECLVHKPIGHMTTTRPPFVCVGCHA
jgi:hypothetical protein